MLGCYANTQQLQSNFFHIACKSKKKTSKDTFVKIMKITAWNLTHTHTHLLSKAFKSHTYGSKLHAVLYWKSPINPSHHSLFITSWLLHLSGFFMCVALKWHKKTFSIYFDVGNFLFWTLFCCCQSIDWVLIEIFLLEHSNSIFPWRFFVFHWWSCNAPWKRLLE